MLFIVNIVPYTTSAKSKTYRLTSLGRTMAKLPVAPRYAKMLSLGHQHDLLPYVVAMVSALSVQEMFVETFSSTESLEEVCVFKTVPSIFVVFS